jgi:hypothetical protein
MNVIRVEPHGNREFDVEVSEDAAGPTRHAARTFRVAVDEPVLAALGIGPDDTGMMSALVRESFAFLLAREPAGAILRRFDLSVISRYFPEYLDEIRASLALKHGGPGD